MFCGRGFVVWKNLAFLIVICNSHSGNGRAANCKSVDDKAGSCISIKNCPVLYTKTFSGPLDLAQVRMLQKLTCGFDKDIPRVCCPFEDTSRNDSIDSDNIDSLVAHPKINLLPTLNECGKINISLSDRIIGGNISPHGSQPWLVRLGYHADDEGIRFYCGASLISKRFVLTAAHCVTGDEDNLPFMVRLGEWDVEKDPDCSMESGKCSYKMDVGIERIISHQHYSQETKQNDIALIKLSRDVPLNTEFIQPICLPLGKESLATLSNLGLPENPRKAWGFVSGFGSTKWDVLGESQIVQYVQLPIVSNAECQSIYHQRTVITKNQLCAGGEADKDSCDGDSGGAFIVFSEGNIRYYQVGIVSFGPTRCGSGGLAGIYTRMGSNYLTWILDNIEPS